MMKYSYTEFLMLKDIVSLLVDPNADNDDDDHDNDGDDDRCHEPTFWTKNWIK